MTKPREMNGARIAHGWAPVPLRGFRIEFEMHARGLVRRRAARPGARWLQPSREPGLDGEWGYRLEGEAVTALLAGEDIFRAFGLDGQARPDWAESAGALARRENRRERNAFLLAEPLCALLLEGEAADLDRLAAVREAGCPWERARIRGDALGADPVLGF